MCKTTHFPMFVDMKNKIVLVFGGGKIAERRVSTLYDFGADITVVSTSFTEKIEELDVNKISLSFDDWLKSYSLSDFKPFIVLACTNNSEINNRIYDLCKQSNIIVNLCDDPNKCDFYFPAIVRKDNIVIGVSSDGKCHKDVKNIAARLRNTDLKEN